MQSPKISQLTVSQSISTQDEELEIAQTKAFTFNTAFKGKMEVYSDVETFAQYLNAHENWFCRCAEPMKAEPLQENGYTIIVGRFGAFGYEVEPKMSVILHPPEERFYLMNSIPTPNYTPPGYEVDFKSTMELIEIPSSEAAVDNKKIKSQLPKTVTKVNWQLHLFVTIKFPKFIYKLPSSLIQKSGDRLLSQIVRQISPQLTYKVQKDFHTSHNLPIPPKSSRTLERIGAVDENEDQEI